MASIISLNQWVCSCICKIKPSTLSFIIQASLESNVAREPKKLPTPDLDTLSFMSFGIPNSSSLEEGEPNLHEEDDDAHDDQEERVCVLH